MNVVVFAHLTNTGFGPFYDGLTHLFVTPEDLLPVAALSLLAGLRGPRYGRAILFALPAACLAGTFAVRWIAWPLALPPAMAAVTIGLGALVAADGRLPLVLFTGLAIGLGLFMGGLNGMELARVRATGLVAAGGPIASFVVVALLAGWVASLRALWARVVAPVAGSWIAAIGLFMLGWAARRG
jgi:urease accessory protein